MRETDRRTLLATLATGTVLGLAGCSSDGNETTAGATGETTERADASETTTATPTTAAPTPTEPAETTADVHVNDLAWPSLRADPGNSGRSRVATTPASAPNEAWTFSPPDASGVGPAQYVPAVAEGTVYAPMHPNNETFGVYALDPNTGESEWTFEYAFGETRSTEPVGNVGSTALDESRVYATDVDVVLAVGRDGTEHWTSDATLFAPRTVNDGVYGLGAPSGGDLGVVGFEAETGSVRIHWPADGFPRGVGFDADRGYVLADPADVNGIEVVAVSLSDASEVWRTPVNDHGEGVFPQYPVVHRNTVLVSKGPVLGGEAVSQGVVALDADTGRERWSVAVGPDADSNVGRIVAAGDTACVVERFATEPDAVRAYDLADGSLRWEYTVGTSVGLGDGAFAAGDTLYVPGGPTVALSLADGTERWRAAEGATAPLAAGAGGFYRPGANGLRAYRS